MVSLDPLASALCTMALAAAGEWLHARRCRRIRHLAFGPGGRPRHWVRTVPFLRVAALGALAWGFMVLLQIDRAIEEGRKEPAAKVEGARRRHLVIGLDVSPSMHLRDAAMSGQEDVDAFGPFAWAGAALTGLIALSLLGLRYTPW